MSSIRSRLASLKSSSAAPKREAAPPPEEGPWSALGCRLQETEEGAFIYRARRFSSEHSHGNYELGKLTESAHLLAGCFRLPEGETVAAERLLFFDTETTGLGIGAGNIPFMVGLGFYEAGQFQVEQLLIRNPAEERAMLAYLERKLARYHYMVSFNGRTFDWPLLQNRFVLNRMKQAAAHCLQLDLLYPSRAIWRTSLESCRLGNIELARLGIRRIGDLPGSMAPAQYFKMLADGNPEHMRDVLEHNENDILTLAVLAHHFALIAGGQASWEEMELEELYRTAVWLSAAGKAVLADRLFVMVLNGHAGKSEGEGSAAGLLEYEPEGAGTGHPSGSSRSWSYWPLVAAHYKKKGRIAEAVPLWQQYTAHAAQLRTAMVEPFIELAMYCEHTIKDYTTALEYTEEAQRVALQRSSLVRRSKETNEQLAALRKRKDRLQAKLARQAEGTQAAKRKKSANPPANRAPRPHYAGELL
ncbi:ribonuclease H-like domain-containing protein [Paenibacillus sp. y28]|uniref:ribonuclease H-like domain-containing protein n=1 Tax=Paenibacillus sp. y28 TaxID=3129110 RepID=UPI00301698FA